MRPEHPAKASSGRTGRHEPIRSTTSRIAARGAGLGLTMAAGVAGGVNYLQRDLELALLAGAQVGSVAAGMAFIGAFIERRRMTPGGQGRRRPGGQAGRRRHPRRRGRRPPAGPSRRRPGRPRAGRPPHRRQPETGRALGLLGRVAVLRALL